MASPGEKLLSALRKSKSKSSLYAVPDVFFDDEEKRAFEWLKGFVEQHSSWPTARTFQRETGVDLPVVNEALSYYMENSRKGTLWNSLLDPFKEMRNHIKEKDPDEFVQLCRDIILMSGELTSGYGGNRGLVTLQDSIRQVEADFEIAKATVGLRGIPTGYPFLNEATDGLQGGTLTTIVARTGVGKSNKLLKMAKAARDAGYSVLFLSMEMVVLQLARRYFGLESKLDPKLIRTARLSTAVQREMQAQLNSMADMEGPGFWWLAGNFKKSVPALRVAAMETGADLIIADAAYLLKTSDRTKFNAKHELLGDVQDGLTDLCLALDRPLVQSVQFNRTAVKSKRSDDSDEERSPVAHLALEKIGGTDTIGHNSSLVVGITKGDPIADRYYRYGGTLKVREDDTDGWYKYNYRFRPVNMEQVGDYRDFRDQQRDQGEAPDLSYMDAEV